MRVYELMAQLSGLPAGAEVVFERLAEKSELPKWDGDTSLTYLRFEIWEVTCDEPSYGGGPSVVKLDGWSE